MHTKFQGNQPFGSGEEDFLRFLPYMGMAAILVMWPGQFEQTFVTLSHRSSIWNLTLTGPMVSEENILKSVDDGWRRTMEAYLSYKLTKRAFCSGELKRVWGADRKFHPEGHCLASWGSAEWWHVWHHEALPSDAKQWFQGMEFSICTKYSYLILYCILFNF